MNTCICSENTVVLGRGPSKLTLKYGIVEKGTLVGFVEIQF